MVRKKIDNRLRILIENGVAEKHRSMFVVVGDHGRDQIVILHHMLSKAVVKTRPTVLWCYKKELGFSSHRKKRMKQIQRKIRSGKLDVKEDDPFELFVSSTNIRYCYYAETHKILGSTYGMCILQDFEALTPNLLARTVETVEGGGAVVILLRTMKSLKKLYTMTMDVHSRYRTESHQDVVGRFNERFLLSMASCKNCMVIDDQFNLLPLSSQIVNIQPVPTKSLEDEVSPELQELRTLKESLQDTQPVGALINTCRTLDQGKALLKFVEAISEKTLRSTVVMTAARGRGKSAALGLAMATAVGFGYSNIFVTAPSPENLKTVFEFIFKGFDALEYQEHLDYEIIQSTNPEFNKAIVRVNIFREHRQTIQYIHPGDAHKLGQAELVCIDEAAAIPLPLVKNLLGPYLVFMSSTINGYEGTGRSLSLKLVQQLRQQSATYGGTSKELQKAASMTSKTDSLSSASGRVLHEVKLNESIRYANGDPVEKWLNDLLCLDATTVPRITSGCPLPETCDLYYVNRDTLFSYHKASEAFLHRIMSLYVSSHYKNTPNDLQLLSDAPAHHIFVLLGGIDPNQSALPEVLCVIQVCLEGEISKATILNSLSRGERASGDLIPWTVSQQFQDHDFPGLSGGRVVRIATHPDYQGMGYGTRALTLLEKYYEGNIPNLSETMDDTETEISTVGEEDVNLLEERIKPRKDLPPLLLKLSERKPERLDYLGVSFGLTANLLKFWKKSKFTPVYLRQTANDLTGEHSCIMLKMLNEADEEDKSTDSWLCAFWKDFRRRFVSLMSYQFKNFSPALALSILQQKHFKKAAKGTITKRDLDLHLSKYDLKRLELYSQNMVDYHLVMDLLPTIARLYFLDQADIHLSAVQSAILLGMGLQHKTVDELEKDLDLPSSQLLGLFSRVIRKIVHVFSEVVETDIAKDMVERKEIIMEPVRQTMDEDLNEGAEDEKKKQQMKDLAVMKDMDLSEFEIQGTEQDWNKVLTGKSGRGLVSIKSGFKKRKMEEAKQKERKSVDNEDVPPEFKKEKKHQNKKFQKS
ncbi:RNA cytidine acetyltransferase-like isoform X1 [Pecten maximus]|uniref:RNA cytidine acetyltransferase-like isoform X1 n=2 Tax=Pecten maximus TaxID=6579 RepID=UPI00145903A1|nr:RNA cytidine acetyltransferase-like isoform X1 [Pecten maximus]XP_033752199.1 RNA cytidine acetyltransferase-like isoform X1 [Pecten maximus]XP_033752200.1 RNA cytidine acetyltransferase-like isoform X1 [Pecten maximus]